MLFARLRFLQVDESNFKLEVCVLSVIVSYMICVCSDVFRRSKLYYLFKLQMFVIRVN